jgi:hypothetical protein
MVRNRGIQDRDDCRLFTPPIAAFPLSDPVSETKSALYLSESKSHLAVISHPAEHDDRNLELL